MVTQTESVGVDAVVVWRGQNISRVAAIYRNSQLSAAEMLTHASASMGVPEMSLSVLRADPAPSNHMSAERFERLKNRWQIEYHALLRAEDSSHEDWSKFVELHVRLRACGVKLPIDDTTFEEGLAAWLRSSP